MQDEASREKKKNEFEKEIKEYREYAANLEEILADLLMEGGAAISWRMN